MKTQICERCEKELEVCIPHSRNFANIGMVLSAKVRFREGPYAIRTEHRQPFWLCLDCAKELQRWVANKGERK